MSKYSKSWYVAAKSCDVKRGKLKELSLFSKSYVTYRTKNNEVVILEKYCPHMGASLSLGKIIDDCIRCPFHHWSYDKEGNAITDTIKHQRNYTTQIKIPTIDDKGVKHGTN